MKNLRFIFVVPFIILTISCDSDNLIAETDFETDFSTRSIISDGGDVSSTNPYLLTDWEDLSEILLNTNTVVSTPWVNGSSTLLSADFRKDIKKEDGWDMLFHTFKKLNHDPGANYMCFYNKFTGVLKVFYYNETSITGGTKTQWNISQTSYTDKPLRIFDAPNFFSKADDEDSENVSRSVSIVNNVNNNSQGLTLGWNGFEYQIPRYSAQSLDCEISIGAEDITIVSFEFLGSNDQITTGTIKSITSDDKSIVEGTTTQSGDEAIEFINKFDSLMTKLQDVNFIGDKVKEGLKKVTTSKPYDYISKGLKYIFGRSTATTYYTTSKVYLETNGKITLSGTGTTSSPSVVVPITFNIQDILKKRNTTSSQNVSSSIVNANTDYEALGVWNIKTLPRVSYHPAGSVFPTRITKYGNVEVKGEFTPPYFYNDVPEIIFNPAIKPYIKSYKTDIAIFNCLKANKKEYLPQVNDVYGYTMLTPEYQDTEKEIYSFQNYFEMEYQTVFPPEVLNEEDTKVFYFNWGSILEGRLIAYVSVEMDINYKGKEFKVYETRAYPVSYCPFTGPTISEYHNPPYSVVINYYNPFRDDRINPNTGQPFLSPQSALHLNLPLRK